MYFNLTKLELIKYDVNEILLSIINSNYENRKNSFKKLINMSYGTISYNGLCFNKDQNIDNDSLELLSNNLAMNSNLAIEFINGIIQ